MTLPEFLRAHGYATAMFGKWHLGLDWARAGAKPEQVDFTAPFGGGPRAIGFERFLHDHPDLRREVMLLQIAPISRDEVEAYQDLRGRLDGLIGRINGAYAEMDFTPIRYVNRSYRRDELAGVYRASKAALVTPLRDGMNLVAKEYVAAQDPEDPGVLILSRFAGAAAEFKEGALLVNPYDPDAVAAAIARAMAMPLAERKSRHAALYAALLRNDISGWGDRFLSALMGTKKFKLADGAAAPRAKSEIQPLRH